eukprot:scaffold30241_cov28-Tisochrysis_lutea.AAC.3
MAMTVRQPASRKARPASSEHPADRRTSEGVVLAAESRARSSGSGSGTSSPASPSKDMPPCGYREVSGAGRKWSIGASGCSSAAASDARVATSN